MHSEIFPYDDSTNFNLNTTNATVCAVVFLEFFEILGKRKKNVYRQRRWCWRIYKEEAEKLPRSCVHRSGTKEHLCLRHVMRVVLLNETSSVLSLSLSASLVHSPLFCPIIPRARCWCFFLRFWVVWSSMLHAHLHADGKHRWALCARLCEWVARASAFNVEDSIKALIFLLENEKGKKNAVSQFTACVCAHSRCERRLIECCAMLASDDNKVPVFNGAAQQLTYGILLLTINTHTCQLLPTQASTRSLEDQHKCTHTSVLWAIANLRMSVIRLNLNATRTKNYDLLN